MAGRFRFNIQRCGALAVAMMLLSACSGTARTNGSLTVIRKSVTPGETGPGGAKADPDKPATPDDRQQRERELRELLASFGLSEATQASVLSRALDAEPEALPELLEKLRALTTGQEKNTILLETLGKELERYGEGETLDTEMLEVVKEIGKSTEGSLGRPELKIIERVVTAAQPSTVDLNLEFAPAEIEEFSCFTSCPQEMTYEEQTHRVRYVVSDETQTRQLVHALVRIQAGQTLVILFDFRLEHSDLPPVYSGPAEFDLTQGQPFEARLEASDPEGSQLTFLCAECPSGSELNPFTGTFKWTPGWPTASRQSARVLLRDGSHEVSLPLVFNISRSNLPPEIAPPHPAGKHLTAWEGQNLEFQLGLTDPDGDEVSVACAEGCPQGLSLEPSGILRWLPGHTQGSTPHTLYTFTVEATDGAAFSTSRISVAVRNVNRPPHFIPADAGAVPPVNPLSVRIAPNTTGSFKLVAADPDGGSPSGFVCVENCTSISGLVIQPTGVVSLTPTVAQTGSSVMRFSTEDDGGLKTFHSVVVDVSSPSPPANNAPVVTPLAPSTINAGAAFSAMLSASDADGDTLTFSCQSGCPTGLTINSATGALNWTPSIAQASATPYTIRLAASDGRSVSTADLVITVSADNVAPVMGSIAPQSVAEGGLLSFSLSATDADGDTLSYTCVSGCPAGLAVDPASGAVTWSPGYEAAASSPFVLVMLVSDGALSDSENVTVTVTNVNRSPSVAAVPAQNLAEGLAWQLQLTGGDPDGDALTFGFSCATCPAGVSFDSGTGLIQWTPSPSDAGTYAATVSASDGADTSPAVNFNFTVADVNRTPVLSSPGNQSSVEGSSLTFALSGSDPDGDAVSYFCATGCPSGLTVNAANGQVAWSPAFDQAGTFSSVTFGISDGSAYATVAIDITIADTNRAPMMDAVQNMVALAGSAWSYNLVSTDPDGHALSYSCTVCPAGLTVSSSGLLSWTPGLGQTGLNNVTITTQDDQVPALQTNRSFQIDVRGENQQPTLDALSNATIAEGNPLTVQLVAADPDSDPLFYACIAGCPEGLAINGSGELTWTPSLSAAANSPYNITVLASDGSAYAQRTFSVTVTNVNGQPTIASVTTQTLTEDTAWQLQLAGVDPDNDTPLTFGYSCPTCPAGLTLNSSTGLMTWTPGYDDAGTYPIDVTLSDGNLTSAPASFNLVVAQKNRVPAFAPAPVNQAATENVPFSYDIDATDPDGDTLAFACVAGCPAGLTMASSTGVINWTPGYDQAGTHSLTVQISDGQAIATALFDITVSGTNRSPTLAAAAPQILAENTAWSLQLTGSDPDDDTLTYTCDSGCPAGLSVNGSTGLISWTPGFSAADSSPYSVTFRVEDPSAASATRVVTLTVANTNRPPVFAPSPSNQSGAENASFSYDIDATDPDGDALTYACIAGCPGGLAMAASTGVISWTPGFEQSGTHTLVVQVSDGNAVASASFDISVTHVNRSPVLAGVADQILAENSPWSLQLVGSDPDNDALTYSCASGCPAGVSVSGAGLISWLPGYSDAGAYTFTVQVSDGIAAPAQRSFSVNVTEANRAPVLTDVTNKSTAEDTLLSFSLSASDADGDTLTYSCFSGCPTGLVINASTGAVTWTPSYTDAGTYSVVVQASDGKSSVTDAFDITVNNTNRPPVLSSFASTTALDSQNFAVNAVASDPDGQSLAFSCIAGCPAGLFFTGNQLNWTPTADQIGAHNITVQVSDGTDTDAETISVTVYKRPVAVLSGLPVPINTMNESITVTVSGQEVVEYRYAFRSDGSNCSGYGAWIPVATPINENLGAEGLKRLCVYGRNAAGLSPSVPTEVALVKLKNLTTSPGLNVDGEVFDMTLHPDGDLLVVGDFDTYGGDMTHTKLLFVKPTGEIDSNFQSLGGSEVNALAVDSSNRIYVGGSFNRYGNTTVSNFMRLLPDGTLDPAFPPNSTTFIDGTVDAIALNGDESRIFLFGWFDRLGSDIRPGILCLTPAGIECPGFTLKTPADVPFTDFSYDPYLGAVHPTTGDVFAVAWQSTVGGVSVRKIVKFDSDGTMDATFTSNLGTGFSNDVNAIAMVPGQNLLLVGTESGNLNGMNGTLLRYDQILWMT